MEMKDIPWRINDGEKELCRKCLDKALESGASAVRITLNKCLMNELLTLNGYLDKVSQSGDRALTFNVFADGKYGTFSSNRLDWAELEPFIANSIETVKMLAKDEFRKLPDPERTVKNAITGDELGLCDAAYAEMTPEKRLETALAISAFEKMQADAKGYSLISEELVYCDSIYNNFIIDSNGLECMQSETAFEASMEITIQDESGCKYSGYGWNASTHRDKLVTSDIAEIALKRAVDQINPVEMESGQYNMVVENEVAAKLLNPVLAALNGFSLQQQNSFLMDSQDKQVFSEGFTVADVSAEAGKNGARLFDSEGVAYPDTPVIEGGKVCRYFINTYISGKMGILPTVEDCARPKIMPYWPDGPKENISLEDILSKCKNGIFVTGFNGGNSNPVTGDFSYGVEGFRIEDGKIGRPVRGMVITGDMVGLWNSLIAAGSDYRACMNKQIPTLAFKDVDFSA